MEWYNASTKGKMLNSTELRWDFRFSSQQLQRWLSSGLLHCVVWSKFNDISKIPAASTTRATEHESGPGQFLLSSHPVSPNYYII
jgi:hypothetical protein